MKKVLAALDPSLATPVLAAARSFGELIGAEVEAIHVRTDGAETVEHAASAAAVLLRLVTGKVVDEVVAAGAAEDVIALVIGARGLPTDPRPLGATAAEVATGVRKPVLVVPPYARPPTTFSRVLVPLEGNVSSSAAPWALIEPAREAELDLVALHVLGSEAIPAVTDQPQHEHVAWATEFVARYCPWDVGDIRLELRIGRADELVPLVAEESGSDLIALAWSSDLAPGRAPVVRAALERSRCPVLLVPVAEQASPPPELRFAGAPA